MTTGQVPDPAAPPAAGIVVHGVLLEVFGHGVLVTGQSGAGKSELALALVERGHRLVADDAPRLVREGDAVVGRCPDVGPGFIEVRGLGILNLEVLHGPGAVRTESQLSLIVDLEPDSTRDGGPEHRLDAARGHRELLGVRIPAVALPAGPARALPTLVAYAVRDLEARRTGYDARADLDARLARLRRKPA